MTLYHFTARRFLPGIQADGLLLGCLPLCDRPIRVEPGWQWLTSCGDYATNDWAEGTGRLAYSRREIRLTIGVSLITDPLYRWIVWGSRLTPMYQILSEFGDPEHWWVWKGTVPPGRILLVEAMESRKEP